jgi:LPXTG-site transpeptidase (sortase) family protein
MKKFKHKLIIAFGLIVFGFFSLFLFNRSQQNVNFPITDDIISDNISSQDLNIAKSNGQDVYLAPPINLSIDEINLDIQVEKGYYNKLTRQWNISTSSAFWSVMTSKPNNSEGVTFIYGHNRASVFSNLGKIQEGATANVKTEDGKEHKYRFKYSYTTKPEDTSILSYQGPSILALQTCSGATFQNRTIYIFEFVGNQNA